MTAILFLLVISTVSWRQGVYFSGALDPVVAVKAALSVLALALTAHSAANSSRRYHLGSRTLLLVALYLAVTCLGGWAAGGALASLIVAFRVMLLLVTTLVLLSIHEVDAFLTALVRAMGLTAAIAVLTGIATLKQGRLQGGVPAISPNEVAFLCGIVVLYLVRRVLSGGSRRFDGPLLAVLLAVMWLTGSRTGLVTLTIAVLLLVLQARVIPVSVFVGFVSAVPLLLFLTLGSSAVSGLFTRGGNQNLTTLSSRTIAWSAALTMKDNWWQQWFGGGLAMKHIPVSGQYWSQQILDSSWLSALVEGGVIGLAVVALLSLAVVVAAVRAPRSWRPLWTSLLVFTVGRSFLESGLFDASTTFIVFAMIGVTSERASRAVLAEPVAADAHLPPGRALPRIPRW